jgi:hypothetical protein
LYNYQINVCIWVLGVYKPETLGALTSSLEFAI